MYANTIMQHGRQETRENAANELLHGLICTKTLLNINVRPSTSALLRYDLHLDCLTIDLHNLYVKFNCKGGKKLLFI